MTTVDRIPGRPPPFGAHPELRGRPQSARLSVVDRVQTAAVFYISAWTVSPPLFVNEWARMAAVVAFGLWLLGELTRPTGIVLRPGPRVLVALVFMAYTAAISANVDGAVAVIGRIQTYFFLLFLIFFESARRAGLTKYRWVLWGALLLLPGWMATTLSALGEDRFAARTVVRASEEAAAYMASGVGGYGLVYATVLAIPPLVYLLGALPPLSASRANTVGRVWALAQRLMVVAGLALALTLVIRAGYSIAVLSLALGLIGYLLLRGRTKHRALRITLAVAVSVIALATLQTSLLGVILDGLQELAYGTSYRSKIEDVRASLEMNTSVGTLYDRTERYMRSIQLFFENPLVGSLSYAEVGKHSTILDTFAQFGVAGGAALLYLVFATPVMLLRASASRVEMAGVTAAFLIILAICTTLNNVSASMGFVAFILYPLALTYLRPSIARGAAPAAWPNQAPGRRVGV